MADDDEGMDGMGFEDDGMGDDMGDGDMDADETIGEEGAPQIDILPADGEEQPEAPKKKVCVLYNYHYNNYVNGSKLMCIIIEGLPHPLVDTQSSLGKGCKTQEG